MKVRHRAEVWDAVQFDGSEAMGKALGLRQSGDYFMLEYSSPVECWYDGSHVTHHYNVGAGDWVIFVGGVPRGAVTDDDMKKNWEVVLDDDK